MSGINPVTRIFDRFSSQEKQDIASDMDAIRRDITLREIREAITMQSELNVTHLKKTLEDMGGELVITAHFASSDIRLN